MPYQPYESETFSKQLKQLCKKDKPLERQLDQTLDDIIIHPENFDSSLKANLFDRVKKKAVRERYRIVYRYCDRCVALKKQRCEDCQANNRPQSSIIFEQVFHRDDGYGD